MTDTTEIELCLAVYRTLRGLPPAQAIEELRRAVDAMPAEVGPSPQILREGAAEFLEALCDPAAAMPRLMESFKAYLSDCRAREETTERVGWGYEHDADLMG